MKVGGSEDGIIFFRSGNTEYIAKLIAGGLSDECMDLFDRIRSNDKSPLYSEWSCQEKCSLKTYELKILESK